MVAMPDPALTPRLTALAIEDLVALLRRAGAHLDAAQVRADLAAGAPMNPDGTVSLLAYGAWLVQEQARREVHHGR